MCCAISSRHTQDTPHNTTPECHMLGAGCCCCNADVCGLTRAWKGHTGRPLPLKMSHILQQFAVGGSVLHLPTVYWPECKSKLGISRLTTSPELCVADRLVCLTSAPPLALRCSLLLHATAMPKHCIPPKCAHTSTRSLSTQKGHHLHVGNKQHSCHQQSAAKQMLRQLWHTPYLGEAQQSYGVARHSPQKPQIKKVHQTTPGNLG